MSKLTAELAEIIKWIDDEVIELIEMRYVALDSDEDSAALYETTPAGREALAEYKAQEEGE
jgi:hypothetical protein